MANRDLYLADYPNPNPSPNPSPNTWYTESKANRDLYLADYAKLYLDVMRPAACP